MARTPETLPQNPENQFDNLGETNRLVTEKLARKHEALSEGVENGEARAETARIEALESAISIDQSGLETEKGRADNSPARRRGPISKKEREASFKKTMDQVQEELPVASRTFSKVIHHKAIERASGAVGSTVARPNAILAGSVSAFILTLAIYVIARNMGYPLSGFESIATFIIGWLFGLLFDYLRIMIIGKSR